MDTKVQVQHPTKLVCTPVYFDAFKTKWGYVAYSYADFKKLKRINFIHHIAVVQANRWKRWVRKLPHNRVLKETIRDDKHRRIGSKVVGPAIEPMTCDLFSTKLVDNNRNPIEKRWFTGYVRTDRTVHDEYVKSHRPVTNAEDVQPPKYTSAEIDILLKKSEEWIKTLKV